MIGFHAEVGQYVLAFGGLNAAELEAPVMVVADNEIAPGITETTQSIEKYDVIVFVDLRW